VTLTHHSQEAKDSGCRNILALRGDPPAGKDDWEAVEGGFSHGIDLVKHIRKEYGDYFDVAVAGFPQIMGLPKDELAREMQFFKDKCDAGVDFIFTQMFYDVDQFISWTKAVRQAGITIPIVPGINPIQTWNGFLRSTKLAEAAIPQWMLDLLEPHKNDDEKVRQLGTKIVADMCRKILDENIGVRGFHVYTMNLEKATKMLMQELSLVPRQETVKPLPWRQVSHFILVERTSLHHSSHLLPRGARKLFALFSGRIVRNLISLALRTGTSTLMVALAILAVPHTATSMRTARGLNIQ
jgi:methylenetetrahydrofolate reductase (NADPH)